MSKSSREYYKLHENDDWEEEEKDPGDEIDWVYEQMRDPDYPVISIDYSDKSWDQFQKDLLDPSSELVKTLAKLGQPPF